MIWYPRFLTPSAPSLEKGNLWMQPIIAAHRRDKLMAKIQLDKLYDWPHAKKRGVKDLMLLFKASSAKN